MRNTKNRGFASMDAIKQKEIAKLGGIAVSTNRQHMSKIGKKGGTVSGISKRNARLVTEGNLK